MAYTLTANCVRFDSNMALDDGGAIFLSSGGSTIHNSTFIGNNAGKDGNHVFAQGAVDAQQNWWATTPIVPNDVTINVNTSSPLLTDPTAAYATGDYYNPALGACQMHTPVPLPETPTPTPIPTFTPTTIPTCIPPTCALNGNDAIPDPATWSSEQGVYVAALNATVYGDGICNRLGTNEDRLDCADDVYDAYYSAFGGVPTLVNLLAALFDEELGQAALNGGQEPSVEAFANNYLASCSEGCTKAELVWWLASKQGWYRYAGQSLSNLIDDINQNIYSPTAASRIFSGTWTGGYGDGNVPYDWGNWAYGSGGYASIRGGTQNVEYYRVWQAWFDYHSYNLPYSTDRRARCDNGYDSGSNRVPSDFWTDYIFAIVTFNQDQALPAVSTYLACLNYQSSSPRTNRLPASEADEVSSNYEPGSYDHNLWP
jgi:hypothetical protein